MERKANDPDLKDVLLLTEHPPVITQGRGADGRNVLVSEEILRRKGISLIRTNRGGDVTYHGPGQTVGYPILRLEEGDRDLHVYLRGLEEVVLATLKEFDISGTRRPGETGVWVDGEKICSIGVGIRRWITFHGFALNVTADLEPFRFIVPCGLPGCRMTSIARQFGRDVDGKEVRGRLVRHFGRIFRREMVVSASCRLREVKVSQC